MLEYLEVGWRPAVIASVAIFAWSVSSSLERIARAVDRPSASAPEAENAESA